MGNITFVDANTTPYFPRALSECLAGDLKTFPVVAVMGARQVGKSTLCRGIAERARMAMCTLDDRDVLRLAREDPEELLHELGGNGAFIDEVQRAPELFLAIKGVVDRDQAPGQYLLSGSNQPQIRGGVAESLLGRAAYRTLRPLTQSELRLSETHAGWSFTFNQDETAVLAEFEGRSAQSGDLDWREIATTGGFPRAVSATPERRSAVLDQYVTGFTTRDIRDVIGLESSERFEAFFRVLAARTGQELNHSSLSRDLGIPVATVRRWGGAVERSYLSHQILSYSRNASERVIKAPKTFFADSGLAMTAAREIQPTGFHFETLVATDLCVWTDLAPRRGVYHWRQGTGAEVDFVLEENGRTVAVEVKGSDRVGSADAAHLRSFMDRYPTTVRGLLLSADPAIRILRTGVLAAPWWAVL